VLLPEVAAKGFSRGCSQGFFKWLQPRVAAKRFLRGCSQGIYKGLQQGDFKGLHSRDF